MKLNSVVKTTESIADADFRGLKPFGSGTRGTHRTFWLHRNSFRCQRTRQNYSETRFTAKKAPKPSLQHVLRHPIKPAVALGDYRRGKSAGPASRAGTSTCRNHGARTNRDGRTRGIPESVLIVQPHLAHPSAGAQLALEGVSSICRPSVGGAVQFAKPQDDCPNVREVSEQIWRSSRRTIRGKFVACTVHVTRPETLGWQYNVCSRPTPAPLIWRSPCQRRSSQNRSTA